MLFGKKISIIFACSTYAIDNKLVIGYKGRMPWEGLIPSDVKRLKDLTAGQSVLIGYKTWESIPEKYRPFDKNLPIEVSRQTIVLSKKHNLSISNSRLVVARSFEEAVRSARSNIIWVEGGAEIFRLALYYADFIHETMIYERFPGDTFFPDFDKDKWPRICYLFTKAGERNLDRFNTLYSLYKRKRER